MLAIDERETEGRSLELAETETQRELAGDAEELCDFKGEID